MTVEQWLDHLVKVLLVGSINLCRDFKWHVGALRDLDGLIEPLLGGGSSQEGEILAGNFRERIPIARHAVINGPLPIDCGQRLALRIRNRHHRHVGKYLVKRLQIRNIQSPVKSSHINNVFPAAQ